MFNNELLLKKHRPLTSRETSFLDKELEQGKKRLKFQHKFLLGYSLLAVLIGSFVFFKLDSRTELYLLIGTEIVYILIGVLSFIENYFKIKKQLKSIDFAKISNDITSIRVSSDRYIELSEVEDQGVHYLFQLANSQILLFGGQDFYPSKKFPSDDFEIAICYGENEEIVFQKKYTFGKKLKPVSKITGKKKWDLLARANFPDSDKFTFIEGNLDKIEEITAHTNV